MNEVISRSEAKEKGLNRYFTGVPCKNGHVSERHVCDKTCIVCKKKTTNTARKKNTEKVRDYMKSYRKEYRYLNRDRINQHDRVYSKEYRRKNPEYVRACDHARRARKQKSGGSHTSHDIKRIFVLQKGKCAYCKERVRSAYHIDHIVPLSKGGTNWPNNIQITCVNCNLRKSKKDPIEFAQQLGMLL